MREPLRRRVRGVATQSARGGKHRAHGGGRARNWGNRNVATESSGPECPHGRTLSRTCQAASLRSENRCCVDPCHPPFGGPGGARHPSLTGCSDAAPRPLHSETSRGLTLACALQSSADLKALSRQLRWHLLVTLGIATRRFTVSHESGANRRCDENSFEPRPFLRLPSRNASIICLRGPRALIRVKPASGGAKSCGDAERRCASSSIARAATGVRST